MMSEKRKIQRFNLDEGRIWEMIEGLSPFKTTYTLEEVCEKLNEQQSIIEDKSNVIILMGAFIKSKGFSVDDFNEWISKDWHHVGDDL